MAKQLLADAVTKKKGTQPKKSYRVGSRYVLLTEQEYQQYLVAGRLPRRRASYFGKTTKAAIAFNNTYAKVDPTGLIKKRNSLPGILNTAKIKKAATAAVVSYAAAAAGKKIARRLLAHKILLYTRIKAGELTLAKITTAPDKVLFVKFMHLSPAQQQVSIDALKKRYYAN